MLIEVASVAGGGKTTVAAAVVELLEAQGTTLDVASFARPDRRHIDLLRIARQPRLSLELATHLGPDRRSALNYAMSLLRRSEQMGAARGPIIVDSGVAFGMSRALDHSTSTATRLAARVHRPDVLIDLHIDPATAAARAQARDDGRPHALIRSLDLDELIAFMVRNRSLLDQCIEALADLGVQTIRVDCDEREPTESAAIALEGLRSLGVPRR